jgi:hypothetical protein
MCLFRLLRHLLLVSTLAVPAADPAAAAGVLPPRRKQALLEWLRARTYLEAYAAEPAVHPSVPAHGFNVRVYLSPRLAEDLRSGRLPFRKGAAMVKELYFQGTEDVVGWSVMRKVRRRSGKGGKGWLFYETFDGRNEGALFGRGLGVCTSCHAAGADYLLSPFRPD